MRRQNIPPALSGRETLDANAIPYQQEDEECSLPEKPTIEGNNENEIPVPNTTPQSCQVGDLSEELVYI
jgi:hypothetical protein